MDKEIIKAITLHKDLEANDKGRLLLASLECAKIASALVDMRNDEMLALAYKIYALIVDELNAKLEAKELKDSQDSQDSKKDEE